MSYAAEQIPHTTKGQARLDALPAAGPFGSGPTAHERNLARLQATKQALEAEIQDFVQPDDPVVAGARLGEILSAVTQQWFFDFFAASHRTQDVERPQDRWIDILCKLPMEFESWAARTFILWGRHILPDFIAELFDVEAEACLDAGYAELAAEFDEYWIEIRLNRVDGQTAAAVQVQPQPLPHRPVGPPQKDAKSRSVPHFEVPRLFADEERWQTELEQVRWQDMPPDRLTPFVPGLAPRPLFLVVRLFAGRRRDHDLHSWLEAWAQRTNIALTIILSLDTAISPVLGNLDSSSTTWACLQEVYLQGFVAGFSSARWTEPPQPHLKWPRPLCMVMQLFGLDHRKMRELRQNRAGSAFFLQTIWTLACHLVFGGIFLEEHPGIPLQPHHPSVWRSAIVQFSRKHPDVKFHEIAQCDLVQALSNPQGCRR